MYIKQVIIQGFRSYRDQTVIDPFSAKHNVIVGRNGSGKSNFFLAIEFVLSADDFSNLKAEERVTFLHEGTGSRVGSAFVEIIFDNSDGRMQIDKEEVSLRRVIGSKKDQYFLEKKVVPKSEVMSLLESAGFSRSNPYYIVKQGRINQLAVAKDYQRLQLLKEVAGTRVFDDRKEESQRLLKESESKSEKIVEYLQDIEQRLSILEEEKEELKAYQKWDKERRCLEYTIHDKEFRETKEKLDELEGVRQEGSSRASDLQKEAKKAGDKVEKYSHTLKEVDERVSIMNTERQQRQDECSDQIKRRIKLELDIKDLESGVTDDDVVKKQSEDELKELQVTIEKKQKELEAVMPAYNKFKNEEQFCTKGLLANEQRRTELYAKQGRRNQFSSREDRDRWISKEIKSLMSSVSKKGSQIQALQEDNRAFQGDLEKLNNDIKERQESMEQKKRRLDEANRGYSEQKRDRDEMSNTRKELWRQEAALEQTINTAKEELTKAERNLKATTSRGISNGLETVKRIMTDPDIRSVKGVYGPLIENFTCDERFFTAVEVTAGNKLFHIVVDSDKTAAEILSIINRQKMQGEVTFMPLNKLKFKPTKYPTSDDVMPLISKLNFEEALRPAMELAFGKTLICRDLDVASRYAKRANLDCITLEGDQVSRRGALTGGFFDTSKSRLSFQQTIWTNIQKVEEEEEKVIAIRSQLEEIDGKITSILGKLQKTETKQVQLRELYEKEKLDLRGFHQSKERKEQALVSKESQIVNLQSDINTMENSLRSLKDELGTDLLSQLTNEDQDEVDRIAIEIAELTERQKEAIRKGNEMDERKSLLENQLNNNLIRRRDELNQMLEDISLEDKTQLLEGHQRDLVSVCETIDKIGARLKDLESELEHQREKKAKLQTNLEEWKGVWRTRLDAIQDDAKSFEKIANKRSLLLKKKDECMKNIRELGSLPSDAFVKFQKMATKTLWKKLHHCNEELKKYSHVNKKALDQFVSFSEEKERLMRRKDELDSNYQLIVDMMDVLDQRKHEAILFTFKQVSKYFSEIFEKLVPRGKGTLVMKKDPDAAQDDDDDDSQSQSSSSQSQRSVPLVDQFIGVAIKVSFTGKSAEILEMKQLSGGQKSLVALALIFAIQKCDPAPFYLFDEIDQALDPEFRTAVTEMIRDLAAKAQFITTTFRPELLNSADKFYGVKFRNKVSHVDAITLEEAKDFVEDDEQGKE